MKKLIIAFLGIFLLFNITCSRDDDSPKDVTSLVGTWYLYSLSINGTVLVNGVSTPISLPQQTVSTCLQKTTLVFNENGTGTAVSWDDSSGSCTQIQNETFTYTYNQSTKVLTIVAGSKTDVTTIKSLTASEMLGEETVTNENIGGYVFTGTITSTLKKK